jgi:hypothetical protein
MGIIAITLIVLRTAPWALDSCHRAVSTVFSGPARALLSSFMGSEGPGVVHSIRPFRLAVQLEGREIPSTLFQGSLNFSLTLRKLFHIR